LPDVRQVDLQYFGVGGQVRHEHRQWIVEVIGDAADLVAERRHLIEN
jgi:hypothetical protein